MLELGLYSFALLYNFFEKRRQKDGWETVVLMLDFVIVCMFDGGQ